MPRRPKVPPARIELSLTSMMDLVFNLIMFFVLVNNFAAVELPALETPLPTASVAVESPDPNKVTVSVLPVEGDRTRAAYIQIGSERLHREELGRVTEILGREHRINPEVQIDLRADRELHYAEVHPIMAAIGASGVQKVRVVARTPD